MVAYKQALGRGREGESSRFPLPPPPRVLSINLKHHSFCNRKCWSCTFLAAPASTVLKQFAFNERGPYSSFPLRAWLSPPWRSAKCRMLCRLDAVDLNSARPDFTLPHHYFNLQIDLPKPRFAWALLLYSLPLRSWSLQFTLIPSV